MTHEIIDLPSTPTPWQYRDRDTLQAIQQRLTLIALLNLLLLVALIVGTLAAANAYHQLRQDLADIQTTIASRPAH